jgi:hypothetical protein
MPKTISSEITEQWLIDASNALWTLEDSGSISTNGVAVLEESDEQRNKLQLYGQVHSGHQQNGSVGVELDGTRTHVRLHKGAVIDTDTGVLVAGTRDEVYNHGRIDVTGTGIIGDVAEATSANTGPMIRNGGEISGTTGIDVGNAIIRNFSGLISGTDVAISAADALGTLAVITNYGRISGNVAIATGDGTLYLTNAGHITGSILFGGSYDLADFGRGSRVMGAVDGGDGDDSFSIFRSAYFDRPITGGAGDDTYHLYGGGTKATLVENSDGGTDAIVADFSYTLPDNFERLYVSTRHKQASGNGNDADNMLVAGWGRIVLDGGKGNDELLSYREGGLDTLIGGAGDDTFAFSKPKTVVEDFTQGEDKLAFADSSGIKSFGKVHIEQHGDDTWIGSNGSGGDFNVRAILHGVDASTLTADDFSFRYTIYGFWFS